MAAKASLAAIIICCGGGGSKETDVLRDLRTSCCVSSSRFAAAAGLKSLIVVISFNKKKTFQDPTPPFIQFHLKKKTIQYPTLLSFYLNETYVKPEIFQLFVLRQLILQKIIDVKSPGMLVIF